MKILKLWEIMMQVHDELVLEVDPSYVNEAARLLQTSMQNAVSLLGMFLIHYISFCAMCIYFDFIDYFLCVSVPLHVKLKVGKTWGSLEPFQAD